MLFSGCCVAGPGEFGEIILSIRRMSSNPNPLFIAKANEDSPIRSSLSVTSPNIKQATAATVAPETKTCQTLLIHQQVG